MSTAKDNYMVQALEEARLAVQKDEVPVGAVVVDSASGEIIARAHNLTESGCDPSAHAEILAIRAAARHLGAPRLSQCDLYVTLEPCAMCAAAISHARIRRLYFGAYDAKGGGVDHGPRFFTQPTCHHAPEVYGGINEGECGEILKDFFREKR